MKVLATLLDPVTGKNDKLIAEVLTILGRTLKDVTIVIYGPCAGPYNGRTVIYAK